MHSSTRTILLLLSILLSTSLAVAAAAAGSKRHAKIESCSGWALNKLPQLKSFLKDYNGATSYKNVEVIYIHGRKAVMTIYEEADDGDGDVGGGSEEEENWVEIEQIVLSDYETKVRDIFVILCLYKVYNYLHRSLSLLFL